MVFRQVNDAPPQPGPVGPRGMQESLCSRPFPLAEKKAVGRFGEAGLLGYNQGLSVEPEGHWFMPLSDGFGVLPSNAPLKKGVGRLLSSLAPHPGGWIDRQTSKISLCLHPSEIGGGS